MAVPVPSTMARSCSVVMGRGSDSPVPSEMVAVSCRSRPGRWGEGGF